MSLLLSEEIFLEQGYTKFITSLKTPEGQVLYQKCIRGIDNIKRYYLNIFQWDWTKCATHQGDPVTYSSEVQFRLGEERVNVEYLAPLKTAQDLLRAETFYQSAYKSLWCSPYEEV